MLHQVSEKNMHRFRLLLTISWLILIVSLFFDQYTPYLTANHIDNARQCIFFQGHCLSPKGYRLGTRIFWGMIVPCSIVIVLVFGHEAWRRICPLSSVSQLANAVGLQRRRKIGDSKKTTRYEPIKISKDSWLGRHALTVQFCLLFVGLTIRLLFTNSDPILLGIYLVLTLFAAITVGYLYGGKTWCHYFCPMAPVQVVFTGPSGLLGSSANLKRVSPISQSMCRTTNKTGEEKSACIGCKQSCFDIDAEQAYWDGIQNFDRKLVYYGYVGLVLGFFLYFMLYSGNEDYLANGVWNETDQLAMLFKPGIYIFNKAIPLPKLVAAPLTLFFFSGSTYYLGIMLENFYKQYAKQFNLYQNLEHAQSQIFAACAFLAFNLFMALGVQPSLSWIPTAVQDRIIYPALISVVSIWTGLTLCRKPDDYIKERSYNSMLRQAKKLNIDFARILDGRTLEDLKTNELHFILKIIPVLTHEQNLQLYKGCLKEVYAQDSHTSLDVEVLKTIRKQLKINEQDQQLILIELGINVPT
jgi:hypothetical protein